jgi:flagellar hook-length control protein FliK
LTARIASPASPAPLPPRATGEVTPRVAPPASPAVSATPPLRTPSLPTPADADHAVLTVPIATETPATDIPTQDDTATPRVATKPAPTSVVPTSTRHTAAPAAVPATPAVPPVRPTSTPSRAVAPLIATTELEPTTAVVAESEPLVQTTGESAPAPLGDTTVDTSSLRPAKPTITLERSEPSPTPAEPVKTRDDRTSTASNPAVPQPDAFPGPVLADRTVLPTHNAERLVERLTEMVSTAHDAGRELSVRLAPPELGPLLIEVRSDSGVVTARLETQTDAARQTLLEHLPQLQEALAQRGTPIDRVDIVRTEPRDAATGSFADPQWSTAQQQSQPDQRDTPRRRPPVLNRPTIETPTIVAPPRGDISLREINVTI